MPTSKAEIRRLVALRDQHLADMEASKNKAAGLGDAILSLMTDDKEHKEEAPRASVKATVLDLLTEVGSTGLNAATVLEMASRRDIALDRGSVSSLLSRLKADGIVEYDGDKYRLPHPAHDQGGTQTPVMN